jgi:hypothetical protein
LQDHAFSPRARVRARATNLAHPSPCALPAIADQSYHDAAT